MTFPAKKLSYTRGAVLVAMPITARCKRHITAPDEAESVLREALTHAGPAIIEAVVDPTEPPLPGHVTTKQAWNFARALARGQEDRWDILKTVATNTVREVI